MAGSLNKVTLIGNVGRESEARTTQDGREIVSFSLATSESWRDKASGERKEKTEWHKVVIFAPALVTIVKSFIHKGSKVYLEGALQTRKWTDQNGAEKYTTEIVLQNYNSAILMLDSKASSTEAGYIGESEFRAPHPVSSGITGKAAPSSSNLAEELVEDIPF